MENLINARNKLKVDKQNKSEKAKKTNKKNSDRLHFNRDKNLLK